MNYTENYHLPQWEETDRIMRADFNQMCADIEEGMSENREVGEELAQRITAAEAGAVGAAQAGLFRLAYNHWHYLDALETRPRQMGFFQQSFGKNQTAVEGMLQLDDCCWMANGDEVLSMDNIRPSFSASGEISTSKNTKTAYGFFNAPYGGHLRGVYLNGSHRVSGTASVPYTFTLKESGVTIATVNKNFSMSNNGSGAYYIEVNAVIHAGKSYHLNCTVSSLTDSFTLAFDPNELCLNVTGYQSAAAAISKHIQTGVESQGGLILVHYQSSGAGGTLRLDWDDESYTPTTVRSIQNKQGKQIKEAEFRVVKTIPEETDITLCLDCANGGDLMLYDWGGLLI